MRFRAFIAFAAAAFFAGCSSVPFYVRGGYDEGMPRLHEPLKAAMAVWVERPEKPAAQSLYQRREHSLVEEFERSFEAHGCWRPEKKDDAEVLVEIKVLAWEYNDAGFSGFRERNHVELSVTLSDPKNKLVLQRAYVHVADDFRIIGKYVDSLYEER